MNLSFALARGPKGLGSISILASDGLGAFADVVSHPVAPGDERPRSLAFADLDGYDDVDLVTANWLSNSLTLFFNDGTGAFVAESLPTSELPTYVDAVDVDGDGDGDGDLVVCNDTPSQNTLQVHVNDGDGGFEVGAVHDVYASPRAVEPVDIDLDGWVDLVVACREADQLAVLRNDGAGGLLPATPIDVGNEPREITAADFDADGDPDLAVAMTMIESPTGECWILENDGSGSFTVNATLEAGELPHGVHHADLDNDCDIDIAVANVSSGYITLLLNDGSGAFTSQVAWVQGSSADVWLANLDGEPLPELIAGHPVAEPTGLISVRLNVTDPGDGCFDPSVCDGAEPTDCDGTGLPDECEIEQGLVPDCNGNGVPDSCDLVDAPELDADGNGIIDTCEAVGDVDGNGIVNVGDLVTVILNWGPCDPKASCLGDPNGDLVVDVSDLVIVILNWGAGA